MFIWYCVRARYTHTHTLTRLNTTAMMNASHCSRETFVMFDFLFHVQFPPSDNTSTLWYADKFSLSLSLWVACNNYSIQYFRCALTHIDNASFMSSANSQFHSLHCMSRFLFILIQQIRLYLRLSNEERSITRWAINIFSGDHYLNTTIPIGLWMSNEKSAKKKKTEKKTKKRFIELNDSAM